MSRVALVAVAMAFSFLPKACEKKKPPVEVEPPPPATTPITSATTPPIWHPPESGGVVPASTSAPATPPASAELVKARAAADAKDFKKVRTLLEKKVRGGKCAPEESQLVFRACVQLKDKACSDAVKAKHPEDISE